MRVFLIASLLAVVGATALACNDKSTRSDVADVTKGQALYKDPLRELPRREGRGRCRPGPP
jgi:hypothetical protein